MKSSIEKLQECGSRIRNRLNTYYSIGWHISDTDTFNGFCGALDNLTDSAQASCEYEEIFTAIGPKISVCWGFLQSISTQQDCIQILSDAVGVNWKPWQDTSLKEFRDLRNRLGSHASKAVGHRKGDPKSWASMRYSDIDSDGFSVALYWYESSIEIKRVNVGDVRDRNATALVVACESIIEKMDEIEEGFRSSLRDVSLEEILPNGLGYLFQRIPHGESETDKVWQAVMHLKILDKHIAPISSYIKSARNRTDGIDWLIERISIAISDLLSILEKDNIDRQEYLRCEVLAKGLEHYYTKLCEYVRDVHNAMRESPDPSL